MKYVAVMFLFILMLYPVVAKKHLKMYFAFVTLALSALAYFVVPLPTTDLYRYTDMIGYFREMGWSWAINRYGSSNPMAIVFLYGVSLLNNDRLLPAITVIITYGFSLALLYKASKRFNAKYSDTLVAFVFLMLNLNFCYIVGVVRIYIAYAVLAYFFYVDLVEKKHRPLCFVIYAMLCYFHYAIMVFILLRILYIFTSKLKGALAMILTAAVPAILYIGYWFVDRFTGNSSLLGLVSDKIEGYKQYETFGIWQFLASVARIGVFVIICITAVILFSELKKRYIKKDLVSKTKEAIVINRFTVFCMYITLSVVPFINNYQYVLRTPYFVQMLISVPLLFSLIHMRSINKKYYNALSAFIFAESVIHFAYLLVYVYRTMEFSFVL